jgi:hypothetical protein
VDRDDELRSLSRVLAWAVDRRLLHLRPPHLRDNHRRAIPAEPVQQLFRHHHH